MSILVNATHCQNNLKRLNNVDMLKPKESLKATFVSHKCFQKQMIEFKLSPALKSTDEWKSKLLNLR